MRIVAVVPIKATSERVKNKNFRTFADDRSLFELLIEQLTNCSLIDDIFVSTDEKTIQEYVASKGCNFLLRDTQFCNNQVAWSDVITHVVGSLPVDNDTAVMWCHTTSPLFNRYAEAIQAYKEAIRIGQSDGLVTVSSLKEFIVNDKKRAVNYSWGVWHPYSQNLEKLFRITGALFIAKKGDMIANRYVISQNPLFFEATSYESIDVDTEFDFTLAQMMYENKARFMPTG